MNNIVGRALWVVVTALALFLSVALFGATEIPVVTDIVLNEPPDSRRSLALASDGDGYLAVWTDFRASRPALIATRIRSTGEVLDPTGIFITSHDTQASIVWNGERYLVFFAGDGALRMRAIDRDGVVSGPFTLIEHVYEAAMATNGSRILVSYAGNSERPGTRVAALDMNGSVVLDLEVDVRSSGGPSVAVLPNGSFVAGWNTFAPSIFTLNALRFDADGTRAEFAPHVLGNTYQQAALHANGNALVAAESGRCWGVSTDLQDLSAQAQCPGGRLFSLRGRAALASAEGARNTIVDLSVSVFDEQGHAIEQKPLFKATDREDAQVWSIAAIQKGDDVLIAWTAEHWNSDRLFARVVSAGSLEPKGERVPLTTSADGQLNPAIAVGDTEVLVVWEERGEVYASRITFDGRRLDGTGIRLSTNWARRPRVVFHEGRYAVAFLQSDGIEYEHLTVRFISPRDGLLPEIVRTNIRSAESLALASGGGMLVAFSTVNRNVLATRIHPAGTADPDVLVAHRDGAYPRYPSASWNGSHFLVAWIDSSVTDDVWRATISGRRVTTNLGIDGDVLALADGKEVDPFETPGLASNGGEWFLAWSRENQVRLARIAADGSVVSELPALHGSAPQLTFAGRQLVLAAKSFGNVNIQAGDSFTTIPSLPYDGFSLTSRANKWYTAFTRRGGTDVGHVERVYIASPGPRRRTVR